MEYFVLHTRHGKIVLDICFSLLFWFIIYPNSSLKSISHLFSCFHLRFSFAVDSMQTLSFVISTTDCIFCIVSSVLYFWSPLFPSSDTRAWLFLWQKSLLSNVGMLASAGPMASWQGGKGASSPCKHGRTKARAAGSRCGSARCFSGSKSSCAVLTWPSPE